MYAGNTVGYNSTKRLMSYINHPAYIKLVEKYNQIYAKQVYTPDVQG